MHGLSSYILAICTEEGDELSINYTWCINRGAGLLGLTIDVRV